MNTTPKRSKVLLTFFVWGPTVEEAMNEAKMLEQRGYVINGNPAPMNFDGELGTGVSVSVPFSPEDMGEIE